MVQSAPPAPIRGVWVAGPQHNQFWASAQSMREHMARFAALGLNTVYLASYVRGRSLFDSVVLRDLVGEGIDPAFAGRAPLQQAIEAGHAYGMRVIAWLEWGLVSHHAEHGVAGKNGRTVLATRPQWAALNVAGQPIVKNGFAWLDVLKPEVAQFAVDLCVEVLKNHPKLDGIQGDDRLPALPSEHALAARDLKAALNGVSAFAKQLHAAVKAQAPDKVLSLAPSAYPFAKTAYCQDWPAWLREGVCDEIIPQLYRREIAGYARLARATAQLMKDNTSGKAVATAAGMLHSLGPKVVNNSATLDAMRQAHREAGIAGEVYFHSAGIEDSLGALRAVSPH
jgi:uncharacterized lipoprotein YddW (UPF0748 family)